MLAALDFHPNLSCYAGLGAVVKHYVDEGLGGEKGFELGRAVDGSL